MTYDEVVRLIDSGALDKGLEQIQNAVDARLRETRISRSIDVYGVGDAVVFNELTGTKYMHGQTAKVVGKTRTKLLVRLDNPVGRFARVVDGRLESVDVKVPPSIVDLVSAT